MISGVIILSVIFMLAGIFFFVTATVGILRFPDFFTRLHATGKGDTLAVLLCLISLAIYEGFSLTALKIVFIAVFMALAQPAATHAISGAALRGGMQPWMKGEKENDSGI